MEVYKVWTDLSIKGNAHKKMEDFAKLTKKASKAIADLNKVMMPLNKHLANMAFNLSEVNPGLKSLSTTFIRLNTNTSGAKKSMNEFNTSLSTANNRTQSLIQRTNRLARSMGNVGASAAVTGAHLGRMKVGDTAGGAGIAGKAAGLGLISKLGGAVAPYVGAYAAYGFAKSSFKSATKFESQIGQLQTRGFTPAQIADIRKFSTSQNIPGVSYNDMISAYSNALMATQDPTQAKFLAPMLAKGQFAANQLYHGMTGHQQEELVRFAEFRGRGNPQKTAENLGVGMQMMALSGGTIRPNQLAQFMRYGGSAVSNLTNQSLLAMEPILQLRGGARSGTALQTLALQFSKGQMGKYQALSLKSEGLLGNVELDKNGRPIGSKFGAFKYANQLASDPFGFLMKTYLPALKKQGISDPAKIEQRMQFDFGRTSSQILTSMYENSDKIMRVLIAQGKLAPGTEMYNIATKTAGGAQGRFMAAWENLKTAFGEFEKPAIIEGMNALASLMEKILIPALKWLSGVRESQKNNLGIGSSSIKGADILGIPVKSIVGSIKEAFSGMSVNLDGRKVGQVTINGTANAMGRAGVDHGPSNTNFSQSHPYTSINQVGVAY